MVRIKIRTVAPTAYAPVLAMDAYVKTHLDRSTYELVKIRASAINRCSYCSAMHTRDARKAGERPERIDALASDEWESSGLFDDKERAARRYTDALTRPAGELPESLHDQVVAEWGEKGVVHLAMAVATINTWNRVAIGTGMTAEDLH